MSRPSVYTPDAVRDKLRELLEASKLPQDAFAMVLGCDQAALNSYLQGKGIPLARQKQIRRLVSVESRNDQVFVVLNFTPTQRWKTEVKSRAYKAEFNAVAAATLRAPVAAPDALPTAADGPEEESCPVDRVNQELGQWARSQRVRDYVAAIRRSQAGDIDPASDVGKWVVWLERFADNVDPIRGLADRPAPRVLRPPVTEDDDAIDLDALPPFERMDRVIAEELERLA